MTSILLTVSGAEAFPTVSGTLTSGMVGIPVTIEYDDSWDGLAKNLVCRCGEQGSDRGETRTVLDIAETATVAHEVMKGGMNLYLGIEGYSADGKLVIPTMWADCGKIQYGANVCADPSTDPKLSIWSQLQTEIMHIKQNSATNEQVADIRAAAQAAAAVAQRAEEAVKNVEDSFNSFQNTICVGTADINIKKWFHKKIVVDGSSITKGETGNTLPTWSSFLKDMFALDAVYNHAVSGTGWFFSGSSYVVDRVDAYEADADAVILMGDYNGIYSYTSNAGTIADEAAADGSYYAKLKYLAEKLISKYPLCPIIWVVEPPRASVGQTNGEKTPMNYNSIYALQSKAIEEVADCYGFSHCNLMKNTIFRPWIQANYDETTSDGTHPWNSIQRTMAQVIAETMKRTPLIYNESYVVNPDDSSDDTGDDTGSNSGDNTGGDTEVTLTGITATFTQGDTVIKTTDELDVLRDYLRVVAVYSDLSEAAVTDYTLSGELTEGTSTITVTYGTATTTFDANVTLDDGSVTVALGDVIDESLIGYYFANNTGGKTAREGMRISQYLPVQAGTNITLSGNLTYPNITNHDIVYYDASQTKVGYANHVYGTTAFAVPEGANYFRICFDANDDTVTITYVTA